MQLLNQKKLAERLGLTPRRIRDLVEIGVILEAQPGRFDPAICERRYSIFRDRPHNEIEALRDDLNAKAMRVDRALAKVDAESPDFLERAREAARALEDTDADWALLNALHPERVRRVLENLRKLSINPALASLVEATRTHIAKFGMPEAL